MASHSFNQESENPSEIPIPTPTSEEMKESTQAVPFTRRLRYCPPLLRQRHEPMGSEEQVIQSSTLKTSNDSRDDDKPVMVSSNDDSLEEVDDLFLRVKALLEDSDDIPPLSVTKPRVLARVQCDMNIEARITQKSANISINTSVTKSGVDNSDINTEKFSSTEPLKASKYPHTVPRKEDLEHSRYYKKPTADDKSLKVDERASTKSRCPLNIDEKPRKKPSKAVAGEFSGTYSTDDVKRDKKDTEFQISIADTEYNPNSPSSLIINQKPSKAVAGEFSGTYSIDDVKRDKKDTGIQISIADTEYNPNSSSSLSDFDQVDRETPPLSASSMASSKRLEWDNGADIGYFAIQKSLNITKNVSKITRNEPEGISLIREQINNPMYLPSSTASPSSVPLGLSHVTSIEQNTLLSGPSSFISGLGASNVSTSITVSKDSSRLKIHDATKIDISSNSSQKSNSGEFVISNYIPEEDVISISGKNEVPLRRMHAYDSYGRRDLDIEQNVDNDEDQINSEIHRSESYDTLLSGHSAESQHQELSSRPLFIINKNVSEIPEYVGNVYCNKNVTEFSCSEDNPHIRWYPFPSVSDVQDIRDVSTQTGESFKAEQLKKFSRDSLEEKQQTSTYSSDFIEILDDEKKTLTFQESLKSQTISEKCNTITKKEDVSKTKASHLISFRHICEYSSDSDDKESDIRSSNDSAPSIKSFLKDTVDEQLSQSSVVTKYGITLQEYQSPALESMKKQNEVDVSKEGKSISVTNQSDVISRVAYKDRKRCVRKLFTSEDSEVVKTDIAYSSGKPYDSNSAKNSEMQSEPLNVSLETVSATTLNVPSHAKTTSDRETDRLSSFALHRETTRNFSIGPELYNVTNNRKEQDVRNVRFSEDHKTTGRVITRKTRKLSNFYFGEEDTGIQTDNLNIELETESTAPSHGHGGKQTPRALQSAKGIFGVTDPVLQDHKTLGSNFPQKKFDKPMTQRSDLATVQKFKGAQNEKAKILDKSPVFPEHDSSLQNKLFAYSGKSKKKKVKKSKTYTSGLFLPFDSKSEKATEEKSDHQVSHEFNIELESSSTKVKKSVESRSSVIETHATSRETFGSSPETLPKSTFTQNFSNVPKPSHFGTSFDLKLLDNRILSVKAKIVDAVSSQPDVKDIKESPLRTYRTEIRKNKSVAIQVVDPNELDICDKCHRRKYLEYCHCVSTEQLEKVSPEQLENVSPEHDIENMISPSPSESSAGIAFFIPENRYCCPVKHSLLDGVLMHRPSLLRRSRLRQMEIRTGVRRSPETATLPSKNTGAIPKVKAKVERKTREPKIVAHTEKVQKPVAKERAKQKVTKRVHISPEKERKKRESFCKKSRLKGKAFSQKLAKAAARGIVNYKLHDRIVDFK